MPRAVMRKPSQALDDPVESMFKWWGGVVEGNRLNFENKVSVVSSNECAGCCTVSSNAAELQVTNRQTQTQNQAPHVLGKQDNSSSHPEQRKAGLHSTNSSTAKAIRQPEPPAAAPATTAAQRSAASSPTTAANAPESSRPPSSLAQHPPAYAGVARPTPVYAAREVVRSAYTGPQYAASAALRARVGLR